MATRTLKDNWNNVRNHVRDWWDELTDEDLDTLDSDPNQLVPTLQERYGYTRELAEAEVEKHMASYNEVTSQNRSGSNYPSSQSEINRGQNQRDSSPSQGNAGNRNNQRDSSTANRNRNNESNNKRR